MPDQPKQTLPKEFIEKLNKITNKRARAVIEHILQFGSVSTEDLKNLYGYNHPPRAAKDVRDEGIPLETFRIKGADGRSIAAYRFGDPSTVISGREGGRRQFSKRFKKQLYDSCGGKCAICHGLFHLRELQIDHCIPYQIAGEVNEPELHPEEFILVCGSCNRAKSWSCEHCPNWVARDVSVCKKCYWANPLEYEHVATKLVRRTTIVWEGDEVEVHGKLQQLSEVNNTSIQTYIKALLKNVTMLDQE